MVASPKRLEMKKEEENNILAEGFLHIMCHKNQIFN